MKERTISKGKYVFLGKYGVQRFPYCGRRRNTPCVYRSVDGGIIISNDLFGMTIKQFGRVYKACLNRRNTRLQYILINVIFFFALKGLPYWGMYI